MSSNSPVGSQVSLTQFKNVDNKTGEVNNGYIEADDLKDCKSTKVSQEEILEFFEIPQ